MNDRTESAREESPEASEPRINWDPKLPRSENLKREATELLPGVTFATLFDAVDGLVRKRMTRDSKVDYPLTILRVRRQLDALYGAYVQRGDLDKASGILREQIKLLSLESHIQPLSESDLRDDLRDPYSYAVRDLDPADRHQVIKKRQAFDAELRREVFEKTGRNPDGSEKPWISDSLDPEDKPQVGPGGTVA
jgi:hypothetical protein